MRHLHDLARLYSIQLSYEDSTGKRREASRDSLLAALRARLGGDFDVADAYAARKAELAARVVEPVTVVWGQRARPRFAGATYQLTLENGDHFEGPLGDDGGLEVTSFPFGYHTLRIDGKHETSLFVAPEQAVAPEGRTWGVFAPLYAVRSERTWGVGDLSDLQAYRQWVQELGGGFVATLPLLASFHGDDPSPYSPVSRLFWNELYLDVRKLPEYRDDLLEPLPLTGGVDYRGVAAAKEALLRKLAERFVPDEEFEKFATGAKAYAEFRARRSRAEHGDEFRARGSGGRGGDLDVAYHLYVQYRMAQQLRETPGLYLDFPLGVAADGFDAQHYASRFATGASVGAPPDAFFTKGQSWGFPPLDPDAIREHRHDYFRACIRNHMEHASILRIDHHMGLHRLFWIPEGAEPKDGVYVRYPDEELYAILTIESHRRQCVVLGEDLGTVPHYVPRAMRRHGVRRMYVVQYELKPEGDQPAGQPPAQSVASVNTHDMPTFAGFWSGKDVGDRVEQELLDEQGARRERATREAMREQLTRFLKARGLLRSDASDTLGVLDAVLAFLAGSDAELVLVNLEDLWLECEPQNVPGLPDKSWRRRFRLGLEEAAADESVVRMLRNVNQKRRQADGNQT
jgi:4-alpha-glucanotransferase